MNCEICYEKKTYFFSIGMRRLEKCYWAVLLVSLSDCWIWLMSCYGRGARGCVCHCCKVTAVEINDSLKVLTFRHQQSNSESYRGNWILHCKSTLCIWLVSAADERVIKLKMLGIEQKRERYKLFLIFTSVIYEMLSIFDWKLKSFSFRIYFLSAEAFPPRMCTMSYIAWAFSLLLHLHLSLSCLQHIFCWSSSSLWHGNEENSHTSRRRFSLEVVATPSPYSILRRL